MARVMPQQFHDNGKVYYYIHRHQKHFPKNAALALFEQQKKQGYTQAKSRFKQNLANSITAIDKDAKLRLEQALSQEEVLTDLQTSFVNVLNNTMQESIQSFNLETMINSASVSLNRYIEGKDSKDLDKLFAQIIEASKLLNTDISSLTYLLGRKSEFRKDRDLVKLNDEIQKRLKELEGKKLNVSQSRVKSILGSLNRLTSDLSNKDLSDKNTKQGLTSCLTNIFSTQVGEYIVARIMGEIVGEGLQDIRQSLVGSQNLTFEEGSDDMDLFINFGQKDRQRYKADVHYPNISISLEECGGGNFKISLGVSAKWYKNLGSTNKVSITSENFVHRLTQLMQEHGGSLYYAYNAVGLMHQDNSMYTALKAALVARNIDVFVSGLGTQGDFAQFLIINGEFYSAWDIVRTLEQYNHGQGSTKETGTTDPITSSISNAKNIADITESVKDAPGNIMNAYIRAKIQNNLFNESKLNVHFHPQRLRRILK